MARRALVRRPGPMLANGIVAHIERQPVDVDLARHQWQHYVEVLRANGWETIEVPPADACPDAVFVEDAVVMYRDVAVITRPGAAERRAEIADVEALVSDLGYEIRHIEAPGTLDGGDVLKVPGVRGRGDVIYVGRSARTDQAGIAQFAAIVEPLGAMVVTVPMTRVLHLKSAVTALPDGTVIGWADAVDDPAVFPSFLAMPEESGAHVVILDDETLLIAADCPRSADVLAARGYRTVCVDIGEFVKLEGCVTCLSVRLRA